VLRGKLVYGDNQLVAEMLGGYMAGVTVSSTLGFKTMPEVLNAKKSFEAGVMINGEMTYKGLKHKSCNWRYCRRSFQRYFRTPMNILN
jgi:hypothetical protein